MIDRVNDWLNTPFSFKIGLEVSGLFILALIVCIGLAYLYNNDFLNMD